MAVEIYEAPQTYPVWVQYCNERDRLEEKLETEFSSWCPVQEEVSMIDWGCGFGAGAERFWNVLDGRSIGWNYVGVDPSPSMLRNFRKRIGESEKETTVELHQASFASYDPATCFDLALVIHSLYHSEHFDQVLRKVHDSAKSAVILHRGKRGIDEIQNRFPDWVVQSTNTMSTYQDICSSLDSLGIPYKLVEFEAELDITPCKDWKNEDGQKLINFFLHDPNPGVMRTNVVRHFLFGQPDVMPHDLGLIITNPLS